MDLKDALATVDPTDPSDRWWIVDPRGHRQHWNTLEPEVPDWMKADGRTVTVVNVPVTEEWVCDYCNGDIELEMLDPLTGATIPSIVPVSHNNALCDHCAMSEAKAGDLVPRSATSMVPTQWSTKVCGCPPCVARMEVLYQEEIDRQQGTVGTPG